MRHIVIVTEVNEICSTDRYYRFADKVVRCGREFWHLLSLDGAEIAVATLCDTANCPTCASECPKAELDDTRKPYPLRSTSDIKRAVNAEQTTYLNADGTVKLGHITAVMINVKCYVT